MQLNVFITLASLAAAVAALPHNVRDDTANATVTDSAATVPLTTALTTDTFTASMILESFMEKAPFITTITTNTVWTVTHTVTSELPTETVNATSSVSA